MCEWSYLLRGRRELVLQLLLERAHLFRSRCRRDGTVMKEEDWPQPRACEFLCPIPNNELDSAEPKPRQCKRNMEKISIKVRGCCLAIKVVYFMHT